MTIRVVLAEDNTLLREGIASLLERAVDIDLAGTAADRPELEALVECTDPHVVVTDIRMPPTGTDEGIQIAARLRVERPDIGVVVLSQYAEPAYALALLDGGSEGRAAAIGNLTASRYVAVSLALLFACIGAIGLLHALLVTSRRRGGDVAVARALGFRPRQVRRAVGIQALTLTVEAMLVGIPAGLVIGRLVWRVLVANLGAIADPSIPWWLLGVTVPGALVLAVALAWWPGAMACRGRPAVRLRVE